MIKEQGMVLSSASSSSAATAQHDALQETTVGS